MLRFIVFIIIVFIISRLLDAVRRRQINVQRRTQQEEKPKIRVYREETEIATVPQYDIKTGYDNISQPITIETKSYDEEVFDEESSETKIQQQSQESKIKQQPKKEPVKIAGIPVNTKTIAQGIVISEILKRPNF